MLHFGGCVNSERRRTRKRPGTNQISLMREGRSFRLVSRERTEGKQGRGNALLQNCVEDNLGRRRRGIAGFERRRPRMILRHEGGTRSGYRQSRSGVIRMSRKQCFAERSRAKRSFTRRKRAGRGYMCLSPVWKRAASAALNIAACAEAKPYATHSAINTIPLQSQGKTALRGHRRCKPLFACAVRQAVLIKPF